MNIFKKITAVSLATIFLFSSLGLTISSMVCLKSGKEEVSLALIEDCCLKKEKKVPVAAACCDDETEELPVPETAFIKNGHCCDISNFTIKLNDFKNAQQLSVDQPVVLSSLLSSSDSIPTAGSVRKAAFHYSDFPPPIYGRQLLSFISVLVI